MSRMAFSAAGNARWPFSPTKASGARGGEALVPAGEGVAQRALHDGRADDGVARRRRSRRSPARRATSCTCTCWASPSGGRAPCPASTSRCESHSLRSRPTASRSVFSSPRRGRPPRAARRPARGRASCCDVVVGRLAHLRRCAARSPASSASTSKSRAVERRLLRPTDARPRGAGSSRAAPRPRRPRRRGCRRRSRWRRAPAPAPVRAAQLDRVPRARATLTPSASSSEGSKSTSPAQLTTRRARPRAARGPPRRGRGAGPRCRPRPGRTSRGRRRRSPRPARSRSGSNGRLVTTLSKKRASAEPPVPGPDQDEDLAELRVAVEEQRQRDLADEAGRAGDEEGPCRRGCGRRRAGEAPRPETPHLARRGRGGGPRPSGSCDGGSSQVLGHHDGRVVEERDLRAAAVDGARHVDGLGERLGAVPAHHARARARCRRRPR